MENSCSLFVSFEATENNISRVISVYRRFFRHADELVIGVLEEIEMEGKGRHRSGENKKKIEENRVIR